jgi:hypothetical protein
MEDCSLALVEGVKAEKQVVHQHHRATAKSRQEGFEAKDEEIINMPISSTEFKLGDTAVHIGSKIKAARKELKSGVRKFIIKK